MLRRLERPRATGTLPADPDWRRALAGIVGTTGALVLVAGPLGRTLRRWTGAGGVDPLASP